MPTTKRTAVPYFASSLEHTLAELGRIDLLVGFQIQRARQVERPDDGHGLYLSDAEIDALIKQPIGQSRWDIVTGPPAQADVWEQLHLLEGEIAGCRAESLRRGVVLRLNALTDRFGLTPLDVDILLVCLAPELDLRYERLYAYLQDDVTRKRPSVELVLNLLCPSLEAKLVARQRFLPYSPLLKQNLLCIFDDPAQPHAPLLGKSLKLDQRVAEYLLDSDELEPRLLPYCQFVIPHASLDDLVLPGDFKGRLSVLAKKYAAGPLLLYFQGAYGVGRQSAAEALCREAQLGLLVVDGAQLLQVKDLPFEQLVRLVTREARLLYAALYWTGFDALLDEERAAWRDVLLRELETLPTLSFLAAETVWEPADILRATPFVRVEFPRATAAGRLEFWQKALGADAIRQSAVPALATRFRLSGGQIRDAVVTARNLARWRDPENDEINMDDLYAACRLQSNRKLAVLAQKLTPHYTWDDIVLPPDRLAQLREICSHVEHRARVYDEWGFEGKLALGKGLSALFAGPSGTGKTMAAEIMAAALGLDVYKIDLSTVVSKYIGETEKNLSRIFSEAESSNAILFFDEADALFGKRSEVRDAHDRYANVETSYLLQRMEAYEGVTILASNLRKNIDDAFVRRLRFIVDFPFPEEAERRRIWQKIWPQDTPRDPALDLDFIARRFELAGGNIRNIALAAAFLAAENGGCVRMPHLLRAARREYQKIGKVITESEFGVYAKELRGSE